MKRVLLGPVLALVLVIAGCGGDDGDEVGDAVADRPEPTTTSPEPSSTTSAPTTSTTAAVPFEDVTLTATIVVEASNPTAMAVRPGDDETLFVAERDGVVRPLVDDELGEPLVDISGDVSTGGERGLLGLAFAPDGDRLYLSYTDGNGDSRIDELMMDGDAVDLGSRRQVLGVDQPASNHNGGNIAFGPDGFLYFGLGDGGGAGDPQGNGQNTDTLLGSLLRIDPINRGSDPYAIPEGNPFVAGGGRGEIWAYGLRNPWRFSFDRQTGDLWIGDVGQGTIEEVDLLPAATGGGKGANLGWNRLEGTQRYEGDPPAEHVLPIFEYGRDGGECSVTGGFVYRGENIAGLQGAYVFSDYCAAEVRAIVVRDGRVVAERGLGVEVPNIASFGEDANGELYALSLNGPIYRLAA